MRRMGIRLLFLCAATLLAAGGGFFLFHTSFPSLYEQYTRPLQWAATESVNPMESAAPEAALTAVAEPDEPISAAEPGDIFAFMYHDLTEDESETGSWTTTPEAMRENLEAVERLGYQPLSIEDYTAGNYEAGVDYYIVTFDDGYLSNVTLAEPILEEMGVSACVFVITSGTDLSWHISWEGLAEMQQRGVLSAYTHTHSHLDAEHTDRHVFLADTAYSWDEICAHLEEPAYKILSYPGGAYTRETMTALAADGYDLFVIQNRPAWYEEDNAEGIRILVRVNVAYGADMEELIDWNRARNGLASIAQTLAERAAKESAERAAWLCQTQRPATLP